MMRKIELERVPGHIGNLKGKKFQFPKDDGGLSERMIKRYVEKKKSYMITELSYVSQE